MRPAFQRPQTRRRGANPLDLGVDPSFHRDPGLRFRPLVQRDGLDAMSQEFQPTTTSADAPDFPRVLAVVGALHPASSTRVVIFEASEILRSHGCRVDLLDLSSDSLPLFNPETAYAQPSYASLQSRVQEADVLLLGTPDYHGCSFTIL